MKCYICDTRLRKADAIDVVIKAESGWSTKDDAWIDTEVKVHEECFEQDGGEEYERA